MGEVDESAVGRVVGREAEDDRNGEGGASLEWVEEDILEVLGEGVVICRDKGEEKCGVVEERGNEEEG